MDAMKSKGGRPRFKSIDFLRLVVLFIFSKHTLLHTKNEPHLLEQQVSHR